MLSKALFFITLFSLAATAAPPTLTPAQLKEGEAVLKKALAKEPFAQTLQTLTEKLGKPVHNKNWETDSWFALDGDKCIKLWISATRAGKTTGALDSGKPDDCK